MGTLNTSTAFLKFAALRIEKRNVRGQDIFLREMTIGEKAAYRDLAKAGDPHLAAWLVQHCVVEETGAPIFTPEDFQSVQALSPDFLGDVALEVLRVCGFRFDGDAETPKA